MALVLTTAHTCMAEKSVCARITLAYRLPFLSRVYGLQVLVHRMLGSCIETKVIQEMEVNGLSDFRKDHIT